MQLAFGFFFFVRIFCVYKLKDEELYIVEVIKSVYSIFYKFLLGF